MEEERKKKRKEAVSIRSLFCWLLLLLEEEGKKETSTIGARCGFKGAPRFTFSVLLATAHFRARKRRMRDPDEKLSKGGNREGCGKEEDKVAHGFVRKSALNSLYTTEAEPTTQRSAVVSKLRHSPHVPLPRLCVSFGTR